MKKETTPPMGLAAQAAKLNRQRFRKAHPETLLILEGRSETLRNGDVDYYFRQNSDFLYLSSCDLADCVLLIGPGIDTLLIPRVDDHHRVWLGETETKASAKNTFCFRSSAYSDELESMLPNLLKKVKKVICSSKIKKNISKLCSEHVLEKWRDNVHLENLRVIKTPLELELIQQAIDATTKAHTLVMKTAKPGMYEWEAKDLFDHGLKQNQVRRNAFPTIAGSGVNGSILHYTKENRSFQKGDLLLLDAGGEFHGYAADVTRTHPVSGKFSPRQKELYELVLKSQLETIELIKPKTWLSDLQENVMSVLTEGLLKLGFFKGDLETLLEEKCISLFYPHGCSHQLGLDVHDVSPKQTNPNAKAKLRSNQCLEAGMVITVEPGLYFIKALLKNSEKRKKFKHLVNFKLADSYLDFGGIRIEDDVLVTENGFQVLSHAPKTVAEIEKLKN